MLATERKKNILIVEDEGLIAADIQKKLERLGYPKPVIADSGERALEQVGSAAFDLVLMDIRLKGRMDGVATATALKARFELPVVYITAHSDQQTVNRVKITEPAGYLLKPVSEGDLRTVVQISLYRHEMELQVRTSEAWLATTLSSVGEGIIATDTEGRVVLMNVVAQRLSGWPVQEARGRMLMDTLMLIEEARGIPAKNPLLDLTPGKTRSYRLISRTGSESLVEIEWFENRAAARSLGSITVIRDVAQRRETEARLVQAQRMEAVANLAGGLAHGFNNQLTVILGYADELLEKLTGEDKQDVLGIRQAASVAAAITSRLVTLSRHQIVEVEAVRVNDIIASTEPALVRTLGKEISLLITADSPGGMVKIDCRQLKHVLTSLAANAREAMPEGGAVQIETSMVEVEDPDPATGCTPGSYVRLTFSDSGKGIDRQAQARIFEPCFSAKQGGSGVGLDLALVHSIVTQAGGYISVASEIGRGTTFEILLPSVGSFRRRGEIAGSSCPGKDAVATVLLVEDEDGVRRLMHRYLECQGYQLLEARNAEEALVLAEVYEDPIHVLVTDVVMNGSSGPALAARLKAIRPEIRVLFVSSYAHDHLDCTGLGKDRLQVLEKPFSGATLLERVQQLLKDKPPACE